MYFYILNSDRSNKIKIGITERNIEERFFEHVTTLPRHKYAFVIQLNDSNELKKLEDHVLFETRDYNDMLWLYPNNECRFDISAERCMEIALFYLNQNKIEYQILNDSFINERIDTHRLKFFCGSGGKMNKLRHRKMDLFPFELRGFQVDYYRDMCEILANNNSLRMTVLCRCGKTVLFMKYLHEHMPDLIVYVASKLTLIGEVNERWNECFNLPIHEISSSGSEYADDVGIYRNCILTVCNKSFHKLRNTNLPSNTVFVFDEAHELVYNMDENHPLVVLNEIWQPEMKKIFVTATPVYTNRLDSNKPYMNMPEYYGEHELKFTNISLAIEQKFMSPMKTIVAEYKRVNDTIIGRLNCIADVIEQTDGDEGEDPHSRKVLIYTNSVNNILTAKRFMEERFPEYNVYIMHSGIKTSINAQTRKSFSDDKEDCILINCKMVVAGINIADIDTVALLDPRNNKEDVIQIMFRPRSFCSENPNKIAYMIIPQEADSKDFNTVKMVISELMRNNDPSVVKTKKDLCRGDGGVVGVNISDFINCEENNMDIKTNKLTCDKKDMGIVEIIDAVDDIIMLMMSDYKFHTAKEIHNILQEQGSYMLSIQKISSKFNSFLKKGILGVKYNNKPPHLYYKIKPRLTSQEFIRLMRENNITEEMYPSISSNICDYLWCMYPEREYPSFQWRYLKEEYKTREEIETALEEIENTEIMQILRVLPVEERILYLKEYDPAMPLNISDYGIILE